MTPDEAMAEALLMARGPLDSLPHEERVAVTLAQEVLRLREQCAHLERLALRNRSATAGRLPINAAAGSPVRPVSYL